MHLIVSAIILPARQLLWLPVCFLEHQDPCQIGLLWNGRVYSLMEWRKLFPFEVDTLPGLLVHGHVNDQNPLVQPRFCQRKPISRMFIRSTLPRCLKWVPTTYIFFREIKKKRKEKQISGPSCSKLTMSLVNDSLKFTSSDTQICWKFLLKKCE